MDLKTFTETQPQNAPAQVPVNPSRHPNSLLFPVPTEELRTQHQLNAYYYQYFSLATFQERANFMSNYPYLTELARIQSLRQSYYSYLLHQINNAQRVEAAARIDQPASPPVSSSPEPEIDVEGPVQEELANPGASTPPNNISPSEVRYRFATDSEGKPIKSKNGKAKVVCLKCGAKLSDRTSFYRHKKTHTRGGTIHHCKFCNKSFLQKSNMTLHARKTCPRRNLFG